MQITVKYIKTTSKLLGGIFNAKWLVSIEVNELHFHNTYITKPTKRQLRARKREIIKHWL